MSFATARCIAGNYCGLYIVNPYNNQNKEILDEVNKNSKLLDDGISVIKSWEYWLSKNRSFKGHPMGMDLLVS